MKVKDILVEDNRVVSAIIWPGEEARRLCWDQRIKEARQRGFFTPEDVDLSANWQSCAVGEQVALIKGCLTSFVDYNATPFIREEDRPVLFDLGKRFSIYVEAGRIYEAEITHRDIVAKFEEIKGRAA